MRKYFTTSDYNKITSDILNAKVKEKGLVNKFGISWSINTSDLNKKTKTLATKPKLETEQDKKNSETSSVWFNFFFLVKIFFGDDGFQIMFAYEPPFSMLELKKGKST